MVCHGKHSNESDILGYNPRILGNFGIESGEKLWKAIANLGVVTMDPQRDFQKIIEEIDREEEKGWRDGEFKFFIMIVGSLNIW